MSITSVPDSKLDFSNLRFFDREELIYDSDLKPNERHVLLAVNSFVGADGKCFPKQETLADMTGYARETINRILKKLSAESVIFVHHRFRSHGRGQTSNDYCMNWGELAARKRIPRGVTNDHSQVCVSITPMAVTNDHTSNCPDEQSKELTIQNKEEATGKPDRSPRSLSISGQANNRGEADQHKSSAKQKDQKHGTPIKGSKANGSAAAPRQKWRIGRPLPLDGHGYAILPKESPEVAHDWGCVVKAKYKAVLWTQRDIAELYDSDAISIEQDDDGEHWLSTINGVSHELEAFALKGELPLKKLRDVAIHGIRGSFLSQSEFNTMLQENFEAALKQEIDGLRASLSA